jgi:hypothetical protein
MPETAHPLELAWTLIALVGLLSSLWVVMEAFHDLRAPGTRADPILHRLALWNFGVANAVGQVLTIFAGVGIRAMTLPSPTPSGDPDLSAMLVAAAFIWGELVLTAIPLSGVWMRDWINRTARAEAEDDWNGLERRK